MNGSIAKAISLVKYYGIGVVPVVAREAVFQIARRTPGIETLVARPWGYPLRVPVKIDGIGRAVYVLRAREADHHWMLQQLIRPGQTVVDIGANIGYYALMEARMLQGRGKIIAVEPDRRNLRWLRENIRLSRMDGVLEVIEGGVSNRDGELTLVQAARTNLSRMATDGEPEDAGTSVRVHDLARLLRSRKRVDLIRMDVEGHEIEILESARDLVRADGQKAPRFIVFETHDYGARRERMRAVTQSMTALGYTVRYLASDDELNPQGSAIAACGFRPIHVLHEWGVSRGIYERVPAHIAVDLIAAWRGTRTVCLEYAGG